MEKQMDTLKDISEYLNNMGLKTKELNVRMSSDRQLYVSGEFLFNPDIELMKLFMNVSDQTSRLVANGIADRDRWELLEEILSAVIGLSVDRDPQTFTSKVTTEHLEEFLTFLKLKGK